MKFLIGVATGIAVCQMNKTNTSATAIVDKVMFRLIDYVNSKEGCFASYKGYPEDK